MVEDPAIPGLPGHGCRRRLKSRRMIGAYVGALGDLDVHGGAQACCTAPPPSRRASCFAESGGRGSRWSLTSSAAWTRQNIWRSLGLLTPQLARARPSARSSTDRRGHLPCASAATTSPGRCLAWSTSWVTTSRRHLACRWSDPVHRGPAVTRRLTPCRRSLSPVADYLSVALTDLAEHGSRIGTFAQPNQPLPNGNSGLCPTSA